MLGLFADHVHGIKRCSARQNLPEIRTFSSAVEHFAWTVLVLPKCRAVAASAANHRGFRGILLRDMTRWTANACRWLKQGRPSLVELCDVRATSARGWCEVVISALGMSLSCNALPRVLKGQNFWLGLTTELEKRMEVEA